MAADRWTENVTGGSGSTEPTHLGIRGQLRLFVKTSGALHRDDHIPLLVPEVDVAVGLDYLLQRVGPVDS